MIEQQLEFIEKAEVEYLKGVQGILFRTKAKNRKYLADAHEAEVWMDIKSAKSMHLAPEDYEDLNDQGINKWLYENLAGKGEFVLYSYEKKESEKKEFNIFKQSEGNLESALSNFKSESKILELITKTVKYFINEQELKDSRTFGKVDMVDAFILEDIYEAKFSQQILEKANLFDNIYTNMINQLFKIKCPHLERVHIELGKDAHETYKHEIHTIEKQNLPYNKETIIGIHKGLYKITEKGQTSYRTAQVVIVP